MRLKTKLTNMRALVLAGLRATIATLCSIGVADLRAIARRHVQVLTFSADLLRMLTLILLLPLALAPVLLASAWRECRRSAPLLAPLPRLVCLPLSASVALHNANAVLDVLHDCEIG